MVFEQASIGTITVENKIFRSATHEGMSDEKGYPTEQLIRKYVGLAKNEVGCIITGYAAIMQSGRASNHMSMFNDDSFIEPYLKLTERVHEHNTPIILQLAHCGLQTTSVVTGQPIVAPSSVKSKMFYQDVARALTEDEIDVIIENFVTAIIRAKKANFDGVQLHMAHGYLLAEFLSPYFNRRKDKWGGSLENRFRIIDEIFRRVKPLVGDFPILAKINAYDNRKNGMRLREAIKVAKLLEAAGCSAIEVSCGVLDDGLYMSRGKKLPLEAAFRYTPKYKNLSKPVQSIVKVVAPFVTKNIKPYKNYNVNAANKIKKRLKIPVIVVGGIKSLNDINSILKREKADFISLSRPLIAEPNLIKKFKNGTQKKSQCMDCNYCLVAAEVNPLKCYRGKLN